MEDSLLSRERNNYVYVKTGMTGGATIVNVLRDASIRQAHRIAGVDTANASDWQLAVTCAVRDVETVDDIAEHMRNNTECIVLF